MQEDFALTNGAGRENGNRMTGTGLNISFTLPQVLQDRGMNTGPAGPLRTQDAQPYGARFIHNMHAGEQRHRHLLPERGRVRRALLRRSRTRHHGYDKNTKEPEDAHRRLPPGRDPGGGRP